MNLLSRLFFFFSPIGIFTVSGKSMEPSLSSGQILVITKIFQTLRSGEIIVLKDPLTKRMLVKRVQQVKNNMFYVVGDNKGKSTDSRDFGWVTRKDIIGKVIYIVRQ